MFTCINSSNICKLVCDEQNALQPFWIIRFQGFEAHPSKYPLNICARDGHNCHCDFFFEMEIKLIFVGVCSMVGPKKITTTFFVSHAVGNIRKYFLGLCAVFLGFVFSQRACCST